MTDLKFTVIGEFTKGGKSVCILRDIHGKWFVFTDQGVTQKRLNASEIVRYLANAANEE